jgi:hypothetical protein
MEHGSFMFDVAIEMTISRAIYFNIPEGDHQPYEFLNG